MISVGYLALVRGDALYLAFKAIIKKIGRSCIALPNPSIHPNWCCSEAFIPDWPCWSRISHFSATGSANKFFKLPATLVASMASPRIKGTI
jgi:hypothetical protein